MFGKKLKKMLFLSLAVTAFGVVGSGVPAYAAGYTLNPEVKDATPALKQAAEIGVQSSYAECCQQGRNPRSQLWHDL